MGIINYSFSFLLKLFVWIFIPVLIIVFVVGIGLYIYSKKNKEKENNTKIMNYYSSLVSILITLTLLAIVIAFAASFTGELKAKGFVKGNELFYYGIMATPLIPLLFFVYYLRRFIGSVLTNKKISEDVEVL